MRRWRAANSASLGSGSNPDQSRCSLINYDQSYDWSSLTRQGRAPSAGAAPLLPLVATVPDRTDLRANPPIVPR